MNDAIRALLTTDDQDALVEQTVALIKALPVDAIPTRPYHQELSELDGDTYEHLFEATSAPPSPPQYDDEEKSLRAHLVWRLLSRVLSLVCADMAHAPTTMMVMLHNDTYVDLTRHVRAIVLEAAAKCLYKARRQLSRLCADTLTLLSCTPPGELCRYPANLLNTVTFVAEVCVTNYRAYMPARAMLRLASGEAGLTAAEPRSNLVDVMALMRPTPSLDRLREVCRCIADLPDANRPFLCRIIPSCLAASKLDPDLPLLPPDDRPYLYHIVAYRLLEMGTNVAMTTVCMLAVHLANRANIMCLESACHALTRDVGRFWLSLTAISYIQLVFHTYMQRSGRFRRYTRVMDADARRLWAGVLAEPNLAMYRIKPARYVPDCPVSAAPMYWPVTMPSQRATPVCMETVVHQAAQSGLRDFFTNETITWSQILPGETHPRKILPDANC